MRAGPLMNEGVLMVSKRSQRLSWCLGALAVSLFLAACSQNEYTWTGPVPPAPKNPRNAHVIKKEGSGMNAVGSMQDEPAAAGKVYRGTAALSRDVEGKVKPGETLFVIARSLDGSPTPVAAVKLTVNRFPVSFEFTDKDSMNGQPLPDQVDVLLRLDDDGDLTTRHPNDLVGGPVKATAGEPFTALLSEPQTP